jgi:hypothetical protein
MTDIDLRYEHGDTPMVLALKGEVSRLRREIYLLTAKIGSHIERTSTSYAAPVEDLQELHIAAPTNTLTLHMAGRGQVKADPRSGGWHVMGSCYGADGGVAFNYYLEKGIILNETQATYVLSDIVKRCSAALAKRLLGKYGE